MFDDLIMVTADDIHEYIFFDTNIHEYFLLGKSKLELNSDNEFIFFLYPFMYLFSLPLI